MASVTEAALPNGNTGSSLLKFHLYPRVEALEYAVHYLGPDQSKLYADSSFTVKLNAY
jgi:hypothetical protein